MKPKGYTSVAPYIMVNDAQRVMDFLKQVFGATELRRFDLPDGRVMHAEIKIDDTVIMLAEGGGQWPSFPVWLHVYVPDVDATYAAAIALGAESVQTPEQKAGDQDRRGGFKDPAGNTWWVATEQK